MLILRFIQPSERTPPSLSSRSGGRRGGPESPHGRPARTHKLIGITAGDLRLVDHPPDAESGGRRPAPNVHDGAVTEVNRVDGWPPNRSAATCTGYGLEGWLWGSGRFREPGRRNACPHHTICGGHRPKPRKTAPDARVGCLARRVAV